MATAIDFQAAMKETKASSFARAISVDPKRLRSYLRNTLKVRVSDGDEFSNDAKTALITHFHGEDALAPKGKRTKAASK